MALTTFVTLLVFAIVFIIATIVFAIWIAVNRKKKKQQKLPIILASITSGMAVLCLIVSFSVTSTYAGVRVWRVGKYKIDLVTKDLSSVERAYQYPTQKNIDKGYTAIQQLKRLNNGFNVPNALKKEARSSINSFQKYLEQGKYSDDLKEWQNTAITDTEATNLVFVLSGSTTTATGVNRAKINTTVFDKMYSDTHLKSFQDWLIDHASPEDDYDDNLYY